MLRLRKGNDDAETRERQYHDSIESGITDTADMHFSKRGHPLIHMKLALHPRTCRGRDHASEPAGK